MLHAGTDQRILGYLGRALSLELSALQQYSTQSRLVEAWGLAGVAARLGAEAEEEMAHAGRIISRMLALGVAPNASQLRPVRLGNGLQELLQHNHAFEQQLVGLYRDATRYCAHVGDQDNRVFFEALLDEETAHARHMLEWLDELQRSANLPSGGDSTVNGGYP